MDSLLKVLFFSSVAVLFLFLISKILGKKQIAQLNFIDYVLGISVGSIAAEMATDLTDTPYYYYLVAMTVFLLFDIIITVLERKGTFFKHFLKGKPITIIYNGKIDFVGLKKSKLDMNDMLTFLRSNGYFDIDDIAFAIFEVNGQLSVMPKSYKRPTVTEDLKINSEAASLPNYLIIDGAISYSGLSELNKDISWLFGKANIKSKQELKNIILAIYDDEKDEIVVHTKQ